MFFTVILADEVILKFQVLHNPYLHWAVSVGSADGCVGFAEVLRCQAHLTHLITGKVIILGLWL